MCTECAEILLERMGDKHTEVKKERDGYLEFLKGLQNEGQVTAEEKAAAEKELEEVIVLRNRLTSGSKSRGYGDGRT
jgi:hypothetical protein